MQDLVRDFYQKEGMICANCYKDLNKVHGYAVLCVDCFLEFLANGSCDIQCQEINYEF